MLEGKRRFLEFGQDPTMPFVVEFKDGRRGEAINPLYLLDLIIHPDFSDIDEIETFYLMGVKVLRDLAGSELASQGIRAVVYDGVGPFFDNATSKHEDEVMEEEQIEFTNHDTPLILDGWDVWTVVASMIQADYIRVFEKYPVWSEQSKVQSCNECVFNIEKDGNRFCSVWESPGALKVWEKTCPFVTNGNAYEAYKEVKASELLVPHHKPTWTPVYFRNEDYIGLNLNESHK